MSNLQPTPASFAYPISSSYPTASSEASQSTSQVVASAASSSTQPSASQQSRQAAEEARKDRTLAEFMLMLDEYEPLVRMHCRNKDWSLPWTQTRLDTKWSNWLLPSTRWLWVRWRSVVRFPSFFFAKTLHTESFVQQKAFAIFSRPKICIWHSLWRLPTRTHSDQCHRWSCTRQPALGWFIFGEGWLHMSSASSNSNNYHQG